jgi:hypothetical protein
VLLVEMEVHLRVAARLEDVAAALELATQLGIVVDLAVLDDDARSVLVLDRLVAAREVDDRQAPRAERDGAVGVRAAAVGTAMHERAQHLVDAPVRRPADPAHGGSLGGRGGVALVERVRSAPAMEGRRESR